MMVASARRQKKYNLSTLNWNCFTRKINVGRNSNLLFLLISRDPTKDSTPRRVSVSPKIFHSMAILEEESSSSSYSCDYDVFLNFRGEDTRYNFTDHLYKALWDAAITTFRDDDEIETGEKLKPELERAIKGSRAAIVVISKKYASSTWCLDELVLILERMNTSDDEYIVLPIFYHVDPSHVRKQEESFAEAFAKHDKKLKAETDGVKKRILMEKMLRWKAALVEIAGLKAKVATGRHETMFIEEIVKEIDHKLNAKVLSTPGLLIGMDSRVEEINSWLQTGSSNIVDICSIWGIGGIGKTTMAEYIYASNLKGFESGSFLADIGRSCKEHKGLLVLQKQLLRDVGKKKLGHEIYNVRDATTTIEKALITKRVLLVLDDVDEVEQLDALLGKRGFRPGSKVIITTRSQSLPRRCELLKRKFSPNNYQEHQLTGLHYTESMELLCWHAFGTSDCKEGYEMLAGKVVEDCGGNPLALKVLGGSLYERTMDAWKDTLDLLEKENCSKMSSK